MENFKLSNLENMSKNQCREYIDKYFIPLDNGTHAMYKNGAYEIMETQTIKSVYFNRMTKENVNYYFKEKQDIRSIIYDINKPPLTATELNLCPQIKHQYKPYNTFSESDKLGVEKMLYHIKAVLCTYSEEAYNFVVKWIANMIKGNKNTSCIYLKGPQGAGKTMPIEFIRKYVLGDALGVETGSGPLKTKFNSELAGKLLVQFEELENFSVSEWINISSVLKRIITSSSIMIEAKGQDPVKQENINNYIILSNNDAITDDDGRRYFICPINTKYVGNTDYFDSIVKTCFNDNVGHAFYCYMKEIDTTNFNPQKYPMTTSKLDSFVKRLDNVYKFLKDRYVLPRRAIDKVSVNVFFEAYLNYCSSLSLKAKHKIDFCNTLRNIGVTYYKSNVSNFYKVTLDALDDLAKKYNWIHELDDHEIDETVKNRNQLTTLKKMYDLQTKVISMRSKDFTTIVNKYDNLMKEITKQEPKKEEPKKKKISVNKFFDQLL